METNFKLKRARFLIASGFEKQAERLFMENGSFGEHLTRLSKNIWQTEEWNEDLMGKRPETEADVEYSNECLRSFADKVYSYLNGNGIRLISCFMI